MILDTAERIKYYTERGFWGETTLLDIFKQHVRNYKGRVCIVDPPNKEELVGLKPERLSYEELDRIVDTVATNLIEKGIQKDDIIIVQLPNIWELAMAYLAIARAGAVISPMAVQWRSRELEYIIETTNAKMYISTDNFRNFNYLKMAEEVQPKYPGLRHVVSLKEFREMAKGKIDEAKLQKVKPTANDVFTICWTSGTEADPKGCPLTHNNWIAQGWLIIPAGCLEGDIQLCVAPLVNMSALGVNYVTWIIRGGTFVIHHPFDGELAIRQIMAEKVNYVLLVPAVLNMIVKHPRVEEFDLSSIRSIVTGSAPPSLWSLQEFRRRWNIEVLNMWGQNEGTFFGSVDDVPKELEKRVDVLPWWGKKGVKWPSEQISKWVGAVQTKIVEPDTKKELSQVGEVGHLLYKGPNVISGYFNQPEMTKRAFDEEQYLYTGDLFEIRENNYVKFFDRLKDIIIRGGFNISAQEIENMVQGHPDILDVAAVSMPDPVMGEKVCIYVVPRAGKTVTLESIVSFMKDKGIALYKLPERMEVVKEIPRTPVGKIVKTELRKDILRKLKEKEDTKN